MATVQCKYCKKQFNRETVPFIQIPVGTTGTRFRYAHPKCYQEAKENGLEKNDYSIIDPKNHVLCAYCNKPLLKSDSDCQAIGQNRYAHLQCKIEHEQQPLSPKERLFEFIMNQFGYEFIPPGMQKQIDKMVTDNNMTYSGIHGTLKYFYIIKHNPKNVDNPIGIVPFVYYDAANFFQKLEEAHLKNKILLSNNTQPKDIYITINPPKIEKRKSKEFSFLDNEEAINE